MKSKKLLFLVITLFFIAFIGGYSCNNNGASGGSSLRIAAVLPLSGDVASYGKDAKDGIDLAVDLANKSQSKFTFTVDYQDSKGEPKTAVTVLEKIFSSYTPVAVIGEITSSATASIIPICDKNKTLLISPAASAPNLSGISSYFYRTFPSDIEEGDFIAKTVAKKKADAKVCIVYVNNDYGIGLKTVFEKESRQLGLNILQTFGYDKTATDFKAILTKVKSLGPDVIYMPSYYQDGGAVVKQAKELGIHALFYGSTTDEDPEFLTVAGDAAEGFIYPVSTGFDAKSQDPSVKSFISNYQKKFSKAPGLVSALGYDCAELIITGVLKNGTSSENIKNYILKTKDIAGAAGTMNFDDKGDVHKSTILKIVKDRKFQILIL